MKAKDICIEIHGGSDSPRIEVLDLMKKRGVKFSFGSDAHTCEQMKSYRRYLEQTVLELNLTEKDFIDWD